MEEGGMSELRHTPKPWRYNPAIGAVVCDTPVGAEPLDPETREYYGGEVIAETVTPANGTLIASAPELLEACKLAFKLPRPWMDGVISYF
jgi:hypothetical protein